MTTSVAWLLTVAALSGPALPQESRASTDTRPESALGRLEAARERAARVHEELSASLPDTDRRLQTAREDLAMILSEMGRPREALPLQRRVVDVLTKSLPADHADTLTARQKLALVLKQVGEFSEALEHEEHVLAARMKIDGKDSLEVQNVRNALAGTLLHMGDSARALVLLRATVEALENLVPASDRNLEAARMNFALALLEERRSEEALVILDPMLRRFEATYPDDHPWVQACRTNLAKARHDLGDLRRALPLEEKVLRIYSAQRADDDLALQTARENLGVTRRELGDALGALELLEKVVKVRAAMRPRDDRAYLLSLSNLSAARHDLGDFEGSLALSQAVVDAAAEAKVDAITAGRYRSNLAVSLLKAGRRDEAIRLHDSVLEDFLEHLPEDSVHVLVARRNVAALELATGDLQGAVELLEKVHDRLSASVGPGNPDLQTVRTTLAYALASSGSTHRGRKLIESALDVAEERIEFAASSLSAAEWERTREDMRGSLSTLLCMNRPEEPDPLLDAADLDRILGFRAATRRRLHVIERARAAAETDKAVKKLRDDWLASRHAYHTAWAGGRSTAPGEIASLRTTLEEAETALVRSVRAAAPASRPATRSSRASSPGSCAIVTATYVDVNSASASRPVAAAEDVCAFVATADGGVTRVPLGRAEKIADAVAVARQQLAAATRSDGPHHPGAMATLRRMLAPVLDRVPPGSTRLLLSLDGSLAALPWEALPFDDSSLLCDRYEIAYVDSLAPEARRPARAVPVLLACGGVDYGRPRGVARERGAGMRPSGDWEPLEASLGEATTVRRLFVDRFPASDVVLLSHAAATKDAVRATAGRCTFLHLATHAFVAPASAWLLGRDVAALSDRLDGATRATVFDRGLLSGVVLAGANGAGSDAILTASEIGGLDLGSCDLAVVSACESNAGPRIFGEGVGGLNRALGLAGARNRITSLWKVEDEGAAAFFAAFYEALWSASPAEASPARALGQARAQLRARGYGPGVWAAFVLYQSSP